jgi:ketosteroid isomerase-like protein
MKKFIFFSLLSAVLFSCNDSAKTESTASASPDSTSTGSNTKALYEKNLATLQAGLTAFENEKMDDWAATIADNAVWNSPAYGAKPAGKAEWKQALTAYTTEWDSLKLVNPTFLPGIDSVTHEFDGSVRYYGNWEGVHKSGTKTSVNFYGTFEFDKDGKVVDGSDFFDVGGLMNAIKSK